MVIKKITQLRTWRLWVSYLGTHFAGFQRQSGLSSIESALEEALFCLSAQRPVLTPAGRTDAGVHARGQVVSCHFESDFTEKKLPLALSHFLRPDITVYRADQMPDAFDARRQAIGKRYVYRISQSERLSPFEHLYTWYVPKLLNWEAMQIATQYLIGEHDFESFRSVHCVAAHARRYIWKLAIDPKGQIDIRGNAFCHNMVRIIVGTLVDVGLGKLKPKDLDIILTNRNRQNAGRTAPAYGLTLEEVYYPDDLSSAEIPTGAIFPRYPVTKETWPC